MDILTVLPLGLFIGMSHALETDHLIAVTALQSKGGSAARIFTRGAAWGVGHTLSLFAVCISVFFLGLHISQKFEAQMEFCVGVMIIGLGAHVLWRLHRDRIHLHNHEHDGKRHIHLHNHVDETVMHDHSRHSHSHKLKIFSDYKATIVGMVHGLAGSAGFLILMSASANSFSQIVGYLIVFGLGTIVGMAFLTLAISFPLFRFSLLKGIAPSAVTMVTGVIAIGLGSTIAFKSLVTVLALS